MELPFCLWSPVGSIAERCPEMLEYSLPDRSEYPVNAGVLLPAELSGRARRVEIRREENNRRRIKWYSHRIKLDSTDAELYLLRAEAYRRSMMYAGARNDFRTACDLGKDAPSVAHAVARI